MPAKKAAKEPTTVTLYPTHRAHIPGEPAVVREVTPEKAQELLRWKPPAYTTEPPQQSQEPQE